MDFRRLDLNLLLILDAMFEERSTTATARRLRISQPTVSFSLNKLRNFFSDDLFVRRGATMQPTPFAETIYEPIRRIVETVNKELLREHDFDPLTTEQTFTISTPDVGELASLPQLLKELRTIAPKATVHSVGMQGASLEHEMANGRIDVALGYFPELTGAGFYQQSLFEHPFTCLVRRDHPTIGNEITLDQFLAAEHMVVKQIGQGQDIFERRLAELNLNLRIVLVSSSFMSVAQLVATSDMIAVVPRAVGLWARTANVKLIEPPIAIPLIEVKQFWHRRVHNDPGIVWLRELIARLYLNRDPTTDPDSIVFGKRPGRGSTRALQAPATR